MMSCVDDDASKALAAVCTSNQELVRKAVITVFLFKNQNRWAYEDHSLEVLQKDEGGEDEDEDQLARGRE